MASEHEPVEDEQPDNHGESRRPPRGRDFKHRGDQLPGSCPSVTVLVAVVPLGRTIERVIFSPGRRAASAVPRSVASAIALPSIFWIRSPALIPALLTGPPGWTATTTAPGWLPALAMLAPMAARCELTTR